jgi:hypothetical protein
MRRRRAFRPDAPIPLDCRIPPSHIGLARPVEPAHALRPAAQVHVPRPKAQAHPAQLKKPQTHAPAPKAKSQSSSFSDFFKNLFNFSFFKSKK